MYDQQSGRFLQEDPIGVAGGINLYQYAGNSPANFSDPFGLCPPKDQVPCGDRREGWADTDPGIGDPVMAVAALLTGGGAVGARTAAVEAMESGVGKIVIGETMSRVRSAAAKLGAETFETIPSTAKGITMSEALLRAIKAAMESVAKKYGLQVVGEKHDRSYTAVQFANKSTGLLVAVDWSELRPFLTLYRLTEGKFPLEDGGHEAPGHELHAFDVDDLLLMRPVDHSPVGKMLPGPDTLAAGHLLVDYARALDLQASDVLRGDFTVFERLNLVIAERARLIRESR
jgi:hypothetical protein